MFIMEELQNRRDVYATMLSNADGAKQRRYTRIVAQYDRALKLAAKGELVSTEELPNPPGMPPLPPHINAPTSNNNSLNENDEPEDLSLSDNSSPSLSQSNVPTVTADEESVVNKEDLDARLQVYQSELGKAKEEGNLSKVRRYERIIGQYQKVITAKMNGQEVDISELPNPPGFPPLSITGAPSSSRNSPNPSADPSPIPSPVVTRKPEPSPSKQTKTSPTPTSTGQPRSRAEVQTQILQTRRNEYRAAALSAHRAGNKDEALRLLRLAKGFDRLIGVSISGLPVDMNSIPPPLSIAIDSSQDVKGLVVKLQGNGEVVRVLSEQWEWLVSMREARNYAGDIANANRFEKLALDTQRDLKKAATSNENLPVLIKEHRTFSIPRSNPSVSANTLTLEIIQATGLPTTSSCYVQFSLKAIEGVEGYTSYAKQDKNTWKFGFSGNFSLDGPGGPGSRVWARTVRRHSIKFEIWAKGGLFAKDQSIGDCSAPLLPLQTDVEWVGNVQLMHGRRPVAPSTGGCFLQVALRTRNPVLPTNDNIERDIYFLNLNANR